MIKEVVIYPNKILTKKTARVRSIDSETKKLIEDMVETLYNQQGAGLAANQVGVSKQIAVINTVEGLAILINPKIVDKKGKVVAIEGCLSFPGLELEIKRPQKIAVEYMDRQGQTKKIKAEDLLARVICHEVDHLQGKTMLDRIGLFKRLKIKKQLKKAQKK